VILGMDWMKQNQAVIQCQQKVVVVNAPNGGEDQCGCSSAKAANRLSESA
jgi:hypothetical protein